MLTTILNLLRDLLRPRHDLLLENLALRQQILVLERQINKPKFRDRDRLFWVILSRLWAGWKTPLRLVKPQTIVAWHRFLWRKYWRWKSRPQGAGQAEDPHGDDRADPQDLARKP